MDGIQVALQIQGRFILSPESVRGGRPEKKAKHGGSKYDFRMRGPVILCMDSAGRAKPTWEGGGGKHGSRNAEKTAEWSIRAPATRNA